MPRAVEEWIGQGPDTRVPARVVMRVWNRFKGVCQCGCERRITAGEPWQCDHVVALINGGENRESNLAPLITEHHRQKTTADVAIKSKTARMKAKHLGVGRQRSRPMVGSRQSKWKRRIDGTVVLRDE